MQSSDQQPDIDERIADAEAEVARAQAHLDELRRESQQMTNADEGNGTPSVVPEVLDASGNPIDAPTPSASYQGGRTVHSDAASSPDAIVDAIAAESAAEASGTQSDAILTAAYEDAPFVPAKDHVAAGLLAITLGCLGIHKFYLGYLSSGFITLGVSIVGGVLTLGIATIVMAAIGIVEGILYLAESQSKFESTHVTRVREWF